MRLSRTGKPLCSQCQCLATQLGNWHLSNGILSNLAYCDEHALAVADAVLLRVGKAVEPVIDRLLYWNMPITADAVYRLSRYLKNKVTDQTDPAEFYNATYEEMALTVATINPARFAGRVGLKARQMQKRADTSEVIE